MSAEAEKRMVETYEITQSLRIGDREVAYAQAGKGRVRGVYGQR